MSRYDIGGERFTNTGREYRTGKRNPPMLVSVDPTERDARQAAWNKVEPTICKGYVHPDETKAFNAVWKQFWSGEITQADLDAWIVTFNSRPRGQQEFKL